MLQHYPSISDEEFTLACTVLEQRCHDNLSGTNWLSVRWHDNELEIKQTGGNTGQEEMQWSVDGSRHENGHGAYDEKASEVEDDMDAVIRHTPTTPQNRPAVEFSVLLSPTYRVPVLWFSLSSTKTASMQDLEEIYSRVVAPGSHEALRGIGIMGGISLANHPLTDKPTFFVHPCNTPEAMVALNDGSSLDPFQYLLLWFGIVGAGVGLHVPSKVAS